MRRTLIIMTLWGGALAAVARGQIGQDAAACRRQWGEPVSGGLDTNGCGRLRFAAGNLAVEMEFISGAAQRAVYRAPTLPEELLQRILSDNSDGVAWSPYRRPGRVAEERGQRMWARPDDAAMAELAGDVLTVWGARWYPRLAEPAPAGITNGLAGNGGAGDTATAPPPPSPPVDPLVGFWRSRGDSPLVALHARADGELAWVFFSETERRRLNARWKRADSRGQPGYTVSEPQPQATAEPQPAPIGRLEIEPSNLLRWERAAGSAAPTQVLLAVRGLSDEMRFERAAALPAWKPKPPAKLPAKGDSRDDVLQRLGKPAGAMSAGKREVLLYPWGRVWIAQGMVVETEWGPQP